MHMFYQSFAPQAPDEPVGGDGTTPIVPDPVVQEPASPWSDDLSRAFPDEGQRGQVDQFLRTTVQPYITRKEQELGEVGNVWNQLWDDDQSFPTYLTLAETLYGEEVAVKLARTLAEHFESEGASPEEAAAAAVQAVGDQAAAQVAEGAPTAVPEFSEWLKTVPPEFREYVTEQFTQREDQTYETQLDALEKQDPTIGAKTDTFDGRALFSRYVASMEGDLGAALGLWQQEMAPMITANPEQFGFVDKAAASAQQAAAAAAAARKTAPTVLGSSTTAGGVTPPQQVAHQTMGEAIHDFMVDLGHEG